MKLTVVFPPHIDFFKMQQRPQRLMEQFARHGHRVLYLNQFDTGEGMLRVEPNLYVLRRHADALGAVEMARDDSQIALWSMWSENWEWADRIKPDLTVYDHIDDFSEWREKLERMVERADLISVTADPLRQAMAEFGKPMVQVENGCDFDHWRRVQTERFERPFNMPIHDGHPTIGYIGAVAKWIDWELMDALSNAFPIVMVGPITSWPHFPWKWTTTLLGEVPYKQLPAYMQAMDVLLIPFQLNEITMATNPIKMWEAMAAGKPMIASAMPEVVKQGGIVRIGRTPEEWISHIQQALAEAKDPDAIASRMNVAIANSWTARYNVAIKAIIQQLERK